MMRLTLAMCVRSLVVSLVCGLAACTQPALAAQQASRLFRSRRGVVSVISGQENGAALAPALSRG
jgi:hypothetical protein